MTQSETQADENRLLESVYCLSGGDTHKPVDLQRAGRDLGLSTRQMLLLLCSLVEQGFLLPSEEPNRMALFLTDRAVKKLATVQTHK